jgi:uncharacterized protein (TIGR03086 family)
MLLKSCYQATADVLAAVPADRWAAPSPCTEWTVREVANHLVAALDYFARAVTGAGEGDMEADHVGDDPAAAYRAVADRCLAAFTEPVLAATHPFPGGEAPGWVIANISLSESLVHGWDVATGAGLPYDPPAEAVAEVLSFQEGGGEKPPGAFAAPVRVPPDASPLVRVLAATGREVR